MRAIALLALLLVLGLGPCEAQLIGPGSRWTADAAFFASGNPFIATFGNEPTTCKDASGAVVPCKQINLLHGLFMNAGPIHVGWAMYAGAHMAAHWINQDQALLPGYELVLHTRDTEWSAMAKDKIVADELLNESAPYKYPGTLASFNMDGGFIYQMNQLRMPLLTANIGEIMADADVNPAGWSAVNHFGHAHDAIDKVFQKCSWNRMGLIYDPVQFGYEAEKFKAGMASRGYTIDFSMVLRDPRGVNAVIEALKQSRVRVVMVLAEALPMVWLACAMHLKSMGRILFMHWPGVPWFLNAPDAQDDRCKDPALLVRTLKHNYIGWYPLTFDAAPTANNLTCHPNLPKGAAQGQLMGFMGQSLAVAGAPFGAVAHMGGFDSTCLMALYLRHMLLDKSYTVDQIAARTPDIYEEYLNWAWPAFHGLAGELSFDRIPSSSGSGNFAGQRKTNIEIVLITGDDITKSPYLNSPPPWDIGMIFPNYEVKPDGTVIDAFLQSLMFEDGTACPADHFELCPEGQQLLWGECVACEPGWYLGSTGECEPCPLGTHQPSAGATLCLACAPGTYSNSTGRISCNVCEPGFSRPPATPAMQCLPCSPGTFSSAAQQTESGGMSRCQLCPTATFSDVPGSSSCTPCAGGFSTPQPGSMSSGDCLCAPGSYLGNKPGCLPCPAGFTCPIGSAMTNFEAALAQGFPEDAAPFPLVKAGHYASVEEPLSAFVCAGAAACPGGRPGACGLGRTGMTCVHCPPGQHVDESECVPCTGGLPILRLLLLLALAWLGLTGMHISTNWPLVRSSRLMLSAGLLFGMVVNAVCTIAVFSTLDLAWQPPLSTFFEMFGVFMFDFELYELDCVFRSSGFVTRYATQVAVYPIGLSMMIGGAGLCQLSSKGRRLSKFTKEAMVNSAGFLMSAFFVITGKLSLEGFRCVENPSGKQTLGADTSIICWQGGEHAVIVALSTCTLLAYPLTFLTLTFIASYWEAPLSVKYGVQFTSRVKFLSTRMRPGYAMSSWFYNCRNFAISLMPVLASGSYQSKIILLNLTYLLWLTTQTYHQCWRFPLLNLLDTVAGSGMIFLLLLFSILGGANSGPVDQSTMGWYTIVVAVAIILGLIFEVTRSCLKHLLSKQEYSVFISHHKLAAGLYSRHIKMLLEVPGKSCRPFLDCDNLEHLDTLSFKVKTSARVLIVLTSEVLRRPWCAVEIVTAWNNKVPITVAEVNDERVELTPEFLGNVLESFSGADWHILAQCGISSETLETVYAGVAKLPVGRLQLNRPTPAAVEDCVRQIHGGVMPSARPPIPPVDPAKVVVLVYNVSDDIQASVAYIAWHLFRMSHWDARLWTPDIGVEMPSMAVGLVLLSRGLLTDPAGASGAIMLARKGFRAVTILSQVDFWKPGADWLEKGTALPEESLGKIRQFAPGATRSEFAATFKPLYSILARSFSPEQNENLMREQFHIFERHAGNELHEHALAVERGQVTNNPASGSEITDDIYDENSFEI